MKAMYTLGVVLGLMAGVAVAAPEKPMAPPVDKLFVKNWMVGKGAKAVAGKTVSVHYTGWLYNPIVPGNKGAKFDSSLDRGKPFEFKLGAGQVIKGWDQGVDGMQEGGKRTLVIPPHLGYGAQGAGGVIPPNATLMFEVELLKVK